jgi:hypothetical protein
MIMDSTYLSNYLHQNESSGKKTIFIEEYLYDVPGHGIRSGYYLHNIQ